MNIAALSAGLLSGIIGSMGLGGGTVLIIYLSFFKHEKQITAGGINLLFFIPIAVISVIIYAKAKDIKWKLIIPIIIGGIIGCFIGIFLGKTIGNVWLAKAFGGFLCFLGVKEIINTVKLYLKKPEKSGIIKKE